MKNLITRNMEEVKSFSIMDFGIFKICIMAFGILSGVYFYKFFDKAKPVVWTGFLGSTAYLIYRLFFKGKCCIDKED